MPLTVGIAGCGRVAALHLSALARVDGIDAAAVYDVDGGRARDVAGRFGVDRVASDVSALVGGVDVVAVCTPPRDHASVGGAALAAGRHVLVEKPLTLAVEDADALIAAAPAGVVACTGFNLRVHRQVVAARRMVAEGALGRLLMIRTHWTAAARPPGWRSEPGQGGGPLWEMGIHHLDLWRHLSGAEPVDVQASGDAEAIVLSARTPEGVRLATTIVSGTSDVNEIELIGERGRLALSLYSGDGPRWAPVGEAAGGVGPRLRAAGRSALTLPRQARAARRGGDYLMSFAAEWEAVRDAVRHGGAPHATLADGRAAVALALEAEAALSDGDRTIGAPA